MHTSPPPSVAKPEMCHLAHLLWGQSPVANSVNLTVIFHFPLYPCFHGWSIVTEIEKTYFKIIKPCPMIFLCYWKNYKLYLEHMAVVFSVEKSNVPLPFCIWTERLWLKFLYMGKLHKQFEYASFLSLPFLSVNRCFFLFDSGIVWEKQFSKARYNCSEFCQALACVFLEINSP